VAAYRRLLAEHRRILRRVGIGAGIVLGLLLLGGVGLWWRLGSGPIQLDVVTPWLAAAIEENFGSQHRVEVGGTQIERTENGAAVRIRDIVVRDPDGTVVASAPKAEVRVSGMSLFSGHMRAESLNLVGAEMAVRIERDGDVTVFAGANKRPIATASAAATGSLGIGPDSLAHTASALPPGAASRAAVPPAQAPSTPPRPTAAVLAALFSWIDGIGETGLDGHELRELGLKNGNLTVDDERTGKHWTFQDITVTLERPHGGGVVLSVGSDNPKRRWALAASIKPTRKGYRTIELEGRQVAANDLLLALRLGDGSIQTDVPLSASLRGEIGPDGVPQNLTGRIVADAGTISGVNGADGRLSIDRAEVRFNWDALNRVLEFPVQIVSGGDRITLMGAIQAPQQADGIWSFRIGRGTMVLTSPGAQNEPLILSRVTVSGRYDAAKQHLVIDEGDIGNTELGVAMSGNADLGGGDLHLTAGFAATRMPVESLKRMWPVFISPKVRDWFIEHLQSGTVERVVVAVNAPFETLKADGPPLPDDGLTLEAYATGCVIRPVQNLPALRDADLDVRIVGRKARITVNKATADLPSGRKLVMSGGQFEVPDTAPHEPPATVHFKLDGPVPAAAELLAMDRLRDSSGMPFDPATTRGTMSAAVQLSMPLRPDLPPGSTNYLVNVDATNFSADHLIMGQKVEAAALKVSANPLGFQLKGDVKIGGTPASLEYRKMRGDSDAEVRIESTLDDAARSNFGIQSSNVVGGAIPIRIVGRVAPTADRDGRFSVEADLTSAQIDGLLPGWVKAAGKPARATFTVTTKPQAIHVEDLLIEGAGGGVKGTIDFDGSGELQSASFPSYGFSDGDRTTLRVERAPDKTLRVVMRGDVFDGRAFVKTAASGPTDSQPSKRQAMDVDLDLRIGAVVGYNGEALRSVDLKMSRRAGEIRNFGLTAKIGRDAVLTGDLRPGSGARQTVVLQTTDAGALFRFTDVYSRMSGGRMSISMDAPSGANPMQQGTLSVTDFAVHDESQLERAAAAGATMQRTSMQFSAMKVQFTRTPGRISVSDGVVRGPVLGATIDGNIDYVRDEVALRGTLVPPYGPTNLIGGLPFLGPILGGEKEGLLGMTYEVVGRPGQPVLHTNIASVLAPGIFRKVFEFPAANYPSPGTDDNSRDNYRDNSR